MGAFPSGSGNHISETHLDAGTDKPKDARADLLAAVQRINEIIDSFNDGNGICGLNSSSKIDSAKLTNVIGTDQIVDHAVELDKLDELATDRVLGRLSDGTGDVEAITVDQDLASVASGHTTLATAKAVKDYIDSQISSLSMNVQQSTKTDYSQVTNRYSYQDIPGLTVNITPSSSNSKVLVTVHVCARTVFGYYSNDGRGFFRFYRDSTAIGIGDSHSSVSERATFVSVPTGESSTVYGFETYSSSFLDSPSTTNQITYRLKAMVRGEDDKIHINRNRNAVSGNIAGISSITVQEITQ